MFTGLPAVVAVSQNIKVTTPSEVYFSQSSSSAVQTIISSPIFSSSILLSSSLQSSSGIFSSSIISSSFVVSSINSILLEKKPEVVVVEAPPIIVVSPISSNSRSMADIVKVKTKEIPKVDSVLIVKSEMKQETKPTQEASIQNKSSSRVAEVKSSILSSSSITVPPSSTIAPTVLTTPKSNLTFAEKIKARCEILGCNSTQLIRVMTCESSGNQSAYNAAGPYIGLFQFLPSTFNSYARKIGLSNPDVNNGDDQITVATWMFAQGMSSQWGCK